MRPRARGSVLIISLWMMSVLTTWTVGQAGTIEAAARLVHRHHDILDAMALAETGLTQALGALDADATRTWDAPSEPWGRRREETTPTGRWTVRITDEGGKLNVNTASRDALARLPDGTPALADALVERRAQHPFHHLAELALVPGMTPERLAQWQPLLTVVGRGPVNFNSAPAKVLEALGLPPAPAAVLIAWRNGPDGELGTADDQVFHDVAEIAPALADILRPDEAAVLLNAVSTGRLGVRSVGFCVRAEGMSGRRAPARRTLTALVERQAPGAAATIRGWHED